MCTPVGGSEGRCTARCLAADRCPTGWRCEESLCRCDASAEACDGTDNDCDGRVDEGSGAEIGCAANEVCGDVGCACPISNQCADGCTASWPIPRTAACAATSARAARARTAAVPTCANSEVGDDGVFRTQGDLTGFDCGTYPAFLVSVQSICEDVFGDALRGIVGALTAPRLSCR